MLDTNVNQIGVVCKEIGRSEKAGFSIRLFGSSDTTAIVRD